MNHIFRVVFNHVCQTYQAVAEIAKGQSKSETAKPASLTHKKSRTTLKTALRPLSVLIAMAPLAVHAAPTGGHISAGDASISQHGKITNIQQNSQKAAINWQTFGIKADETVNFKQPNAQAVILNRVIGNEKSVIDGAINANGKVFISNPNGMIFGKNAQINVGALLATTAKIKDQDFMNGLFKFDQATGNITQLGDIKVPTGGVVALIAPIVENKGKITAPQGKVLLASAEQFSITLPDNGQFAYTLDRGTLQGLVDNGGAILADGGHVILTAKGTDAVKKSLIKHTGKIEANTVQNKNGVIELLGDLDNTRLEVSGSLKAEAKENGDGGFIETSAADVKIQETAQISTQAKNGKTGTWLIDPQDFTVSDGTGEHTETGIGAETLSNNLQKTDIKIQTVATGSEQGNIYVNAPVSWDKNKLTLSAHNDIHINKTLNGTGTAKLALEYGQGTADGGESDYYIEKNTPLKDRTAKVNLPEGKNFSTKKGKDGRENKFEVIHKMPEIVKNTDGEWESKFTTDNVALGKDIDVGYTKNFAGFSGWEVWHGSKIDGLGHAVNNVYLRHNSDSQYQKFIGLFQDLNGDRSKIQNIGATNVDVVANGNIIFAGGLLGRADNILNSYATGKVVANANQYMTSGLLVGESRHIDNGYSAGNISGKVDSSSVVGGLVGRVYIISNSHANTNVSVNSKDTHTGGLAGYANNVSRSYSNGNVENTGNGGSGGLVGHGENISDSYATGNISGGGVVGGLGGFVYEITNSYANGNVIGKGYNTGGLAGNAIHISNSYATGNVEGINNVGGLVGAGSSIQNSYALNKQVVGGKQIGGLAGVYYGYMLHGQPDERESKNSFFSTDGEVPSQAIGSMQSGYAGNGTYNPTMTNVTGKTTAELKQKSTYTGWDFDNTWDMKDGELPHLKAVSQSSTVTPVPPVKPIQPNPATLLDDAKKAVAHAELIFKNMKEKQRKVVIEAGQPLDLEPMNKEITKAFIQAKNAVGKLSDGADKDQLAKRLEVIHTLNEIKPVTPPSNPVTPTNSNADYQKAQEAFSHAETVRKNMLNNQERFVKAGKSELANQSLNNWNREIQNAINKAQEAIAKLPNGKDKTILTHKLKGITLLSSVSVNNTRPTNTVSPTTPNGNGHTTSNHTATNTNNTNPPKTPPTKKPENTDIGNALTNGAQAGTLPYTGLAAVDGATSAQNKLKQEQANANKLLIKVPEVTQLETISDKISLSKFIQDYGMDKGAALAAEKMVDSFFDMTNVPFIKDKLVSMKLHGLLDGEHFKRKMIDIIKDKAGKNNSNLLTTFGNKNPISYTSSNTSIVSQGINDVKNEFIGFVIKETIKHVLTENTFLDDNWSGFVTDVAYDSMMAGYESKSNPSAFLAILTKKYAAIALKQSIKFTYEVGKFSKMTKDLIVERMEKLVDVQEQRNNAQNYKLLGNHQKLSTAMISYNHFLSPSYSKDGFAKYFNLDVNKLIAIDRTLIDVLDLKDAGNLSQAKEKLKDLSNQYKKGSSRKIKEFFRDKIPLVSETMQTTDTLVVGGGANFMNFSDNLSSTVAAWGHRRFGNDATANKIEEYHQDLVDRNDRVNEVNAAQNHSGLHDEADYVEIAIEALGLKVLLD